MTKRLSAKVAIVGVGQVACGTRPDVSHKELLWEATSAALQDAGLERRDIDTVISASNDVWEGRALSNQFVVDSLGGTNRSADLRLGENGLYALFPAWMDVATGIANVAVVGAVCKATELDEASVSRAVSTMLNPVIERPLVEGLTGIDLESALATLEARTYLEAKGFDWALLEDIDRWSERRAERNPYRRKDRSVRSERSRKAAVPGLETSPRPDAACALILASEERSKALTKKAAWIDGLGWCSGRGDLRDTWKSTSQAIQRAVGDALGRAGLDGNVSALDVVEIGYPWSYQVLMAAGALGMIDGNGPKSSWEALLGSRWAARCNPSGGAQGEGYPRGVTGLNRVAWVVRQLRQEAADSQVPTAKTGLAIAGDPYPCFTAGAVLLRRSGETR